METLGRYKILKEIGRGAMGVVYQAYDPEIDRTVAIKTLLEDQTVNREATEEALKRFSQEIKVVGQLQHPNIVTLYDVGESGGIKYFAMEYVEGRNLSSWLHTEGYPSLDQALDIIEPIAEGLGYAHGKGVIHRDIKPTNIMISNEGSIKITDFGIARWNAMSHDLTHSLTGTPQYISPEQVGGKGIDYRADIFSLGVLSYELFTGILPFKGKNISNVIHKVLNESPPLPSSINPELPEYLNTIVMTALEKDPNKRQANMTAFKEDLLSIRERPVSHKTVAGSLFPEEIEEPIKRPKARRVIYVTGGFVLVTFLALFVVVYQSVWEPPGRKSDSQAYALAISQARDGNIAEAKKSFGELLQQDAFKDKGLVGLAYLNLRKGNYQGAIDFCDQAIQLNPHNLYAHVLRAQVYFWKKDLAKASAEVSYGLKNAKGASWEEAEAYTLLGRIQDLQGKTEASLSSYEEAILRDPASPVPYTNKGLLLSRLGNFKGAVASYQDLLKVSDNPTAKMLATESQKQLSFQADVKKREWIRDLIEELNQGERKKDKKDLVAEERRWRSHPLTVSVYPFSEKGAPTLDASTGPFLQARVFQKIGAEPGRSIVNREILDGILQELHLAQSKLTDREKALQVGRIAGANLIITGTLFHLGGRLQAVLQVVETETTYVKAALSEELEESETIGAFSNRVAQALSEAIDAAFPVKGKIIDVIEEEIVLNVGRDVGAKPGMKLKVLPGKQEGDKKKAYIGLLTLIQVMEDSCLARVEAKYDDIYKGQRVVEFRKKGPSEDITKGNGV